MSVTSPTARRAGFDLLQHDELSAAWTADLPGSRTPHVVVGLPSFALDRAVYDHYGDRVPPLENRYLYVLLRAREPATEVVFLSSLPAPADSLESYLSLVGAEERSRVLAKSRLVSADDPSWRPLAEKLLERGDIVDELRRYVGGRPAILEPWNIGPAEEELSVALGIPANATGTSRCHLATKSNGRRLLRTAGVAVPEGSEDVTSPAEVVAAIRRLLRLRPEVKEVVVKLDDSVAGDGNVTVPVSTVTGLDDGRDDGLDDEMAAKTIGSLLPPWYVETLRRGGVVEELIAEVEVRSPSAQAAIAPDGGVTVIGTHEQRLGGMNGQVFEGASFPALPEYAVELGRNAYDVGMELGRHGAVGRFSVDFVVSRHSPGDTWKVYGLEINLRKGGTTHTLGLMRLLRGGSYDAGRGQFVDAEGRVACYAATDNLLRPSWVGRPPRDVRQRLADAGLTYDHSTGTGVVVHLLDCLRVDGRMGYTALADSPEDAAELEGRVVAALS
ncbi:MULTISPECIES: peptide ligase PGM1-related protein [Nocardioides]|uniref:Peptide ligase PGM1-related protein n=1 Tax=Nocardioides vastitatis TaxID=2568655 RepID=A0ABW0ZEH2_9ACTN|nr:peptide ligase PGM1-related protein [Nocardioides sp.]THI97910.1 hypothetical protein E7Z54_14195 [Nocardioides sp.]